MACMVQSQYSKGMSTREALTMMVHEFLSPSHSREMDDESLQAAFKATAKRLNARFVE